MKKLLVTGGAGFIGSCFVGQMVEKGCHVIVLDALTYAGHKANLKWISNQRKGKWELVKGSICDGKLVATLLTKHNPSAVVNFAAESHVDNSIASPSVFVETNVFGTFTMLNACLEYWSKLKGKAKKDFRYVQVSTDEVYGSLGATGKFSEKTPMQPNSPYSASKAAGDHFTRAWYHTYGLPAICTNCSNNYGPRQYPEKLIPTIITRAISGKPIPIYGDGKNVRDWIYVGDHCHGVELALTKGKPGETYCFGGNAERTNLQMVDTVCDILDKSNPGKNLKKASNGSEKLSYKEQIKFVKDRLGHDRRYAINDNKACRELGFKRSVNFRNGIKKTVEWYLENQHWCDEVTSK